MYETTAEATTESVHVLVVDDDTATCEMLEELLEGEGYRVGVAQHGREALAYLEWVRPKVIICDLVMPIMDGWQFLSALRSAADWRHIPVIVLAASAAAECSARLAGATAYLQKPFDIEDLLTLLQALDRHQPAASGAATEACLAG